MKKRTFLISALLPLAAIIFSGCGPPTPGFAPTKQTPESPKTEVVTAEDRAMGAAILLEIQQRFPLPASEEMRAFRRWIMEAKSLGPLDQIPGDRAPLAQAVVLAKLWRENPLVRPFAMPESHRVSVDHTVGLYQQAQTALADGRIFRFVQLAKQLNTLDPSFYPHTPMAVSVAAGEQGLREAEMEGPSLNDVMKSWSKKKTTP